MLEDSASSGPVSIKDLLRGATKRQGNDNDNNNATAQDEPQSQTQPQGETSLPADYKPVLNPSQSDTGEACTTGSWLSHDDSRDVLAQIFVFLPSSELLLSVKHVSRRLHDFAVAELHKRLVSVIYALSLTPDGHILVEDKTTQLVKETYTSNDPPVIQSTVLGDVFTLTDCTIVRYDSEMLEVYYNAKTDATKSYSERGKLSLDIASYFITDVSQVRLGYLLDGILVGPVCDVLLPNVPQGPSWCVSRIHGTFYVGPRPGCRAVDSADGGAFDLSPLPYLYSGVAVVVTESLDMSPAVTDAKESNTALLGCARASLAAGTSLTPDIITAAVRLTSSTLRGDLFAQKKLQLLLSSLEARYRSKLVSPKVGLRYCEFSFGDILVVPRRTRSPDDGSVPLQASPLVAPYLSNLRFEQLTRLTILTARLSPGYEEQLGAWLERETVRETDIDKWGVQRHAAIATLPPAIALSIHSTEIRQWSSTVQRASDKVVVLGCAAVRDIDLNGALEFMGGFKRKKRSKNAVKNSTILRRKRLTSSYGAAISSVFFSRSEDKWFCKAPDIPMDLTVQSLSSQLYKAIEVVDRACDTMLLFPVAVFVDGFPRPIAYLYPYQRRTGKDTQWFPPLSLNTSVAELRQRIRSLTEAPVEDNDTTAEEREKPTWLPMPHNQFSFKIHGYRASLALRHINKAVATGERPTQPSFDMRRKPSACSITTKTSTHCVDTTDSHSTPLVLPMALEDTIPLVGEDSNDSEVILGEEAQMAYHPTLLDLLPISTHGWPPEITILDGRALAIVLVPTVPQTSNSASIISPYSLLLPPKTTLGVGGGGGVSAAARARALRQSNRQAPITATLFNNYLTSVTAAAEACRSGDMRTLEGLLSWSSQSNTQMGTMVSGSSDCKRNSAKKQTSESAIIDKNYRYILNVNDRGALGTSLLHVACEFGHRTVVERLLQYGADVYARDSRGRLPIHVAAEKGHAECLPLLLRPPVVFTAMQRLSNSSQSLPPSVRSALSTLYIQDATGSTPLHCCLQNKFTNTALWLVEQGADVELLRDQTGASCADLACRLHPTVADCCRAGDHRSAVLMLLAGMLDASEYATEIGNARDGAKKKEETFDLEAQLVPFYVEVLRHKLTAGRLLADLYGRFTVHATTGELIQNVTGNTALHEAVRTDQALVVHTLLFHQRLCPYIDIFAENADGDTALHLAVRRRNLEMIQLILAAVVHRAAASNGVQSPYNEDSDAHTTGKSNDDETPACVRERVVSRRRRQSLYDASEGVADIEHQVQINRLHDAVAVLAQRDIEDLLCWRNRAGHTVLHLLVLRCRSDRMSQRGAFGMSSVVWLLDWLRRGKGFSSQGVEHHRKFANPLIHKLLTRLPDATGMTVLHYAAASLPLSQDAAPLAVIKAPEHTRTEGTATLVFSPVEVSSTPDSSGINDGDPSSDPEAFFRYLMLLSLEHNGELVTEPRNEEHYLAEAQLPTIPYRASAFLQQAFALVFPEKVVVYQRQQEKSDKEKSFEAPTILEMLLRRGSVGLLQWFVTQMKMAVKNAVVAEFWRGIATDREQKQETSNEEVSLPPLTASAVQVAVNARWPISLFGLPPRSPVVLTALRGDSRAKLQCLITHEEVEEFTNDTNEKQSADDNFTQKLHALINRASSIVTAQIVHPKLHWSESRYDTDTHNIASVAPLACSLIRKVTSGTTKRNVRSGHYVTELASLLVAASTTAWVDLIIALYAKYDSDEDAVLTAVASDTGLLPVLIAQYVSLSRELASTVTRHTLARPKHVAHDASLYAAAFKIGPSGKICLANASHTTRLAELKVRGLAALVGKHTLGNLETTYHSEFSKLSNRPDAISEIRGSKSTDTKDDLEEPLAAKLLVLQYAVEAIVEHMVSVITSEAQPHAVVSSLLTALVEAAVAALPYGTPTPPEDVQFRPLFSIFVQGLRQCGEASAFRVLWTPMLTEKLCAALDGTVSTTLLEATIVGGRGRFADRRHKASVSDVYRKVVEACDSISDSGSEEDECRKAASPAPSKAKSLVQRWEEAVNAPPLPRSVTMSFAFVSCNRARRRFKGLLPFVHFASPDPNECSKPSEQGVPAHSYAAHLILLLVLRYRWLDEAAHIVTWVCSSAYAKGLLQNAPRIIGTSTHSNVLLPPLSLYALDRITGLTTLHVAAYFGHVALTAALLKETGGEFSLPPPRKAARSPVIRSVLNTRSANPTRLSLHDAVISSGSYSIQTSLHAHRFTPLLLALRGAHTACAQLLLQSGADPTISSLRVTVTEEMITDWRPRGLLRQRVSTPQEEVTPQNETLFEPQYDSDEVDTRIIRRGRQNLVDVVEKHELQSNGVPAVNLTALHLAALFCQPSILTMLLQHPSLRQRAPHSHMLFVSDVKTEVAMKFLENLEAANRSSEQQGSMLSHSASSLMMSRSGISRHGTVSIVPQHGDSVTERGRVYTENHKDEIHSKDGPVIPNGVGGGRRPLHYACYSGNTAAAVALLQAEYDLTLQYKKCVKGSRREDATATLMPHPSLAAEDVEGNTPLLLAARHGHGNTITAMITLANHWVVSEAADAGEIISSTGSRKAERLYFAVNPRTNITLAHCGFWWSQARCSMSDVLRQLVVLDLKNGAAEEARKLAQFKAQTAAEHADVLRRKKEEDAQTASDVTARASKKRFCSIAAASNRTVPVPLSLSPTTFPLLSAVLGLETSLSNQKSLPPKVLLEPSVGQHEEVFEGLTEAALLECEVYDTSLASALSNEKNNLKHVVPKDENQENMAAPPLADVELLRNELFGVSLHENREKMLVHSTILDVSGDSADRALGTVHNRLTGLYTAELIRRPSTAEQMAASRKKMDPGVLPLADATKTGLFSNGSEKCNEATAAFLQAMLDEVRGSALIADNIIPHRDVECGTVTDDSTPAWFPPLLSSSHSILLSFDAHRFPEGNLYGEPGNEANKVEPVDPNAPPRLRQLPTYLETRALPLHYARANQNVAALSLLSAEQLTRATMIGGKMCYSAAVLAREQAQRIEAEEARRRAIFFPHSECFFSSVEERQHLRAVATATQKGLRAPPPPPPPPPKLCWHGYYSSITRVNSGELDKEPAIVYGMLAALTYAGRSSISSLVSVAGDDINETLQQHVLQSLGWMIIRGDAFLGASRQQSSSGQRSQSPLSYQGLINRKALPDILAILPSIDAPIPPVSVTGGVTLLIVASFYGQIQAMRVLLECGASVSAKATLRHEATAVEEGVTPLLAAVCSGHHAAARLLLDHQANPDVADECGCTPLHHAARRRDFKMVKLLLRYGARQDLVDHAGDQAEDVAMALRDKQITRVLYWWKVANIVIPGKKQPEPTACRTAKDYAVWISEATTFYRRLDSMEDCYLLLHNNNEEDSVPVLCYHRICARLQAPSPLRAVLAQLIPFRNPEEVGSLVLENVHFEQGAFTAFLCLLKCLPRLEHLELVNCGLQNSPHIGELCQNLYDHPGIRRLSVALNMYITRVGGLKLEELLRHNTHIVYIDPSGTGLEQYAQNALTRQADDNKRSLSSKYKEQHYAARSSPVRRLPERFVCDSLEGCTKPKKKENRSGLVADASVKAADQ